MARSAHASLRPQVLHQLFFQYSPRLDEQAAVNGFVRPLYAPVVGILRLQPTRKSVPATSPESVYSQPSLATAGAGQEGTAGVARRSSRLAHPLHGRDSQDGHHDEKPLDSPSRWFDRGDWRSLTRTTWNPP